MIKYFLVFFMFLCLVSCSDEQGFTDQASSVQSGVSGTKTEMQQPTVQVGPAQNITVKIPAAMWDSFVENQITVPFGLHEDQAYTKVKTCQVKGEGKPIAIGEPIEIIQEETCTHASFTNNSGMLKHYNVGMFKVKVISTGEEGWIFGVSIPESARGSDE